jgi:glycerol uptake facilitator-like aquaporin
MSLRAALAEAVGTAALVAAVVGSGIMADRLTDDTAVALLANAVATGGALIVLIWVFAPLSGAQFNPVVTAVLAARGEVAAGTALMFVAAQVAGGVAGTILSHAMFDLPLVQMSSTARSGAGQWLAEVVATAGLIVTILGTRSAGRDVAVAVGLYITAAYWFTASTSFANPAVTLARSLTDTFAGIAPRDVVGFVLAQVVGAAAGAAIWRAIGPGATAGT